MLFVIRTRRSPYRAEVNHRSSKKYQGARSLASALSRPPCIGRRLVHTGAQRIGDENRIEKRMQRRIAMENALKPTSERISPLQFLVAALCFLTVLIDGFDTQSAAFAGPLLKREFAAGPQALGLIFGLGMFGGLLGGMLLGPLGDRFGRRPLLNTALIIMTLG